MIEIVPALDKHIMTPFKNNTREYSHIGYENSMLYLGVDNSG